MDAMGDRLLKEGCYWVVSNRLLAGSHLAPTSRFGPEQKLRLLIETGINCFVDLTLPREFPPYGVLANSIATQMELGPVHYLRLPFAEYDIPDKYAMRQILAQIDEALEEGNRVFVHCRRGIERTGMVVGCWLIRHRVVRPESVLDYIQALRAGLNSMWHSPTTLKQ